MRPLIVANWKMNPLTLAEAKKLFNSVKKEIKNVKNMEVVICPPFSYISNLNPSTGGQTPNLKLGAQNAFWDPSDNGPPTGQGAYTGEISPTMLKNLGVDYVIIGHSERRRYLKETNEMISKKIKTALKAKLKPILCLGETEKEMKRGKTKEVLENQLKEILSPIPNSKLLISNLILAYEPVWAIGTGNFCRSENTKKVLLFLRKFFKKTPILYGGSVNSQNAVSYIREAGFSGLLLGGVSLDIQEFFKIIKNLNRV